jgi:eight-cysteine-cluster-containing protein
MNHIVLAAMLGAAIALGGCLADGSPRPHGDGACMVTGCSDELCADRPTFSPCIWRDAYACFRDAACGRRDDGACGWSQTDELKACLAAHEPLPGPPGSPPGAQP